MYLNISHFSGKNLGWGGQALVQNGDKYRMGGDWQNFCRMGDPPVPLQEKTPVEIVSCCCLLLVEHTSCHIHFAELSQPTMLCKAEEGSQHFCVNILCVDSTKQCLVCYYLCWYRVILPYVLIRAKIMKNEKWPPHNFKICNRKLNIKCDGPYVMGHKVCCISIRLLFSIHQHMHQCSIQ